MSVNHSSTNSTPSSSIRFSTRLPRLRIARRPACSRPAPLRPSLKNTKAPDAEPRPRPRRLRTTRGVYTAAGSGAHDRQADGAVLVAERSFSARMPSLPRCVQVTISRSRWPRPSASSSRLSARREAAARASRGARRSGRPRRRRCCRAHQARVADDLAAGERDERAAGKRRLSRSQSSSDRTGPRAPGPRSPRARADTPREQLGPLRDRDDLDPSGARRSRLRRASAPARPAGRPRGSRTARRSAVEPSSSTCAETSSTPTSACAASSRRSAVPIPRRRDSRAAPEARREAGRGGRSGSASPLPATSPSSSARSRRAPARASSARSPSTVPADSFGRSGSPDAGSTPPGPRRSRLGGPRSSRPLQLPVLLRVALAAPEHPEPERHRDDADHEQRPDVAPRRSTPAPSRIAARSPRSA